METIENARKSSMLLLDKVLKKLCTEVKFIVDEDSLHAILEDLGVHLKYSFLSDGAIIE
jgi:hypothetical protein